jgi:hypothetical protein
MAQEGAILRRRPIGVLQSDLNATARDLHAAPDVALDR